MTKVEWVNPHAWIHLEHTTESGDKEQWMVEGGTPNTLLARPEPAIACARHCYRGGRISVKDRSNRANGRDVTFVDGSKIFMGSSGTGAPRDGRDPTEK